MKRPIGMVIGFLLGALALGAAPAGTKLKPAFPRLASHDIGDKNYDHADYQAILARYDYVLLGIYNGWHGGPEAARDAVRAIKKLNPAILVGNYTILESTYWDPEKPSNKSVWDPLRKLYDGTGPTKGGGTWTPNDWWARGVDGKLVISP